MEGSATADANLDGLTDGADFVLWQQQYGWTAGKAGQLVPEPTLLATLGGLLPCGCRLRRRLTIKSS
jgi:hypothetical protein